MKKGWLYSWYFRTCIWIREIFAMTCKNPLTESFCTPRVHLGSPAWTRTTNLPVNSRSLYHWATGDYTSYVSSYVSPYTKRNRLLWYHFFLLNPARQACLEATTYRLSATYLPLFILANTTAPNPRFRKKNHMGIGNATQIMLNIPRTTRGKVTVCAPILRASL